MQPAAAAGAGSSNPFNLPAAFLPGAADCDHRGAALSYASALAAFLREHGWLLEVHPVELLTRRPLRRLPAAWQAELRANADPHSWLAAPASSRPTPGSLAAWFAQAAALAMPRVPPPDCAAAAAPPGGLEAQHTNAKKTHELARFAGFVAALAARAACEHVVDAGAGTGRLGGALSSRYGLSVTGVECDADAVLRAARRRAWLDADAARRGGAQRPACVTLHASLAGVSAGVSPAPALPCSTLLAGLHACGELTVDMLRQYVAHDSPYAALAVAGCCYQHASSFPVSQACAAACADDADALLPRRAREAAAQSVCAAFLGRQSPARRRALRAKTLARALLELLHAERTSAAAPLASGKHPYDARVAFSAYAGAALGASWQRDEAAALDARYAAALVEEDAAAATFTAMRCAVGGVAEALLVLDRALLLSEALAGEDGARVGSWGVLPLFDPELSPRNLVIWAHR